MFREYQDVRIIRNLKCVKKLSIVALVFWVICTIVYLTGKWVPFEWMKAHPEDISSFYITLFWYGEDIWTKILTKTDYSLWDEIRWDIIYCLGYFDLVLLTVSFPKYALRKAAEPRETDEDTGEYVGEPKWLTWIKAHMGQQLQEWTKQFSVESKRNNDFSCTLIYAILNLIPIAVFVVLLLAVIIASLAGTLKNIAGGINIVSSHLGGMLLSHVFLVIASGFLIQNCVLIKREWKTNPPPFVVREQLAAAEKQRESEEQAQKLKYEQDIETSKKLLEQCGMQFFIDYYPQLKRLPIRDIILSDNYSSEREVRLPPAKKIVESGLTECALRYIIEKFGDVFSSEVIERAKAILHEIENEKTEVNQNENN